MFFICSISSHNLSPCSGTAWFNDSMVCSGFRLSLLSIAKSTFGLAVSDTPSPSRRKTQVERSLNRILKSFEDNPRVSKMDISREINSASAEMDDSPNKSALN